jgi:squalene-associated FAD-dependent desaturase
VVDDLSRDVTPPAGEGIAVVGAGWAGLACALELTAAGRPVCLFEAAGQAGGRARGVDWQGLRIDNGQHLLVGAYRETLRLIERVGAGAALRRLPLHLETPPQFRLAAPDLPPPLHLAAALLTASGLDWGEKWAAARLLLHLRRRRYRLPADSSVAEFLARHRQGARLTRLLWEPLCLATLNTPLRQASAQVFCHVLRDSLGGDRTASQLLLPCASLDEVFVRPALDWLRARGGDLRLGEAVRGISREGQGWSVAGECFRHVVCAVHPGRVASLLPDAPCLAELRQRLAAFRWQPICTLWLRFATPPNLSFPMLGLCDGPGQWVFDRRDLAPGLLSVVISAEGPHLGLDEEELGNRVWRQLATVLPGLAPPLAVKRITEKRATFAAAPGLKQPGNATCLPGLWLAGDYTAPSRAEERYPATLESAVRSGVECAGLILAA